MIVMLEAYINNLTGLSQLKTKPVSGGQDDASVTRTITLI